MKFFYYLIIAVVFAASSVMTAPVESTPSAVPTMTPSKDPMSGAKAIASITIGEKESNSINAKKLATSGCESTYAIHVASVALPVTAAFFALM